VKTLSVERVIEIAAPLEVVFSFFQDSQRFASWWGAGSTIQPKVGGAVHVVYPGGATAGGTIESIDPPRRIVCTWGYSASKSMPPGGTRLEITLEPVAAGTRVRLLHSGIPSDAEVPEQQQGWRYHLAQFSKAASAIAHANAARTIDQWFAGWNTADATEREKLLEGCATPGVVFRDQFSATDGLADLVPHLAAFHVHMPGMSIARSGDVQVCHNTCLVGWQAKGPDGSPMGGGRNFVEFAPDGRIARVHGFWG